MTFSRTATAHKTRRRSQKVFRTTTETSSASKYLKHSTSSAPKERSNIVPCIRGGGWVEKSGMSICCVDVREPVRRVCFVIPARILAQKMAEHRFPTFLHLMEILRLCQNFPGYFDLADAVLNATAGAISANSTATRLEQPRRRFARCATQRQVFRDLR